MKAARRLTAFLSFIVMFSFIAIPVHHAAAAAVEDDIVFRNWQVQWIGKDAQSENAPPTGGDWIDAGTDNPLTAVPEGKRGMWIRFSVPSTAAWRQPGMLVERLYGHRLSVYEGKELLYVSNRDFRFDLNKLLTPFGRSSQNKEFYIQIITLSERAGLISGIRVGDFEHLSNRYVRKDLPDLLLGSAIAFLALIMLLCSGYLNRKRRKSWIALCLVALTAGTLIFLNSPLTFIYFKAYGQLVLLLYDASVFVLFPALSYYADWVFKRKFVFFSRFRLFQAGYSAFCLVLMAANWTTNDRYFTIYYAFTVIILGLLILAQLIQMMILSVLNAAKGNGDSVILSVGMGSLAVSGVADLALFYWYATRYELFLWKIGVLCMIAALVLILARRISADHSMLVTYSRELEHYNHKLQRTEKLKIISDLAASVAHEVRNPLQVTRGFLQLLGERMEGRNKQYFAMAIDELDRASGIITDFLTFAKPEMDEVKVLNLAEEMRQIEIMMTPLTTMKSGTLRVDVPNHLYISGNSSKLKQALINMVKNSIEAIDRGGLIQISARSESDKVFILIKDNGVGMDEEEVAKLGDPYFSTKTKGTGLGLMVTFRIIEVMQGTLEFRSAKGKGTEAIIRFPAADGQEELPSRVHA
jgi:two-component system sporulation sensor kinase B